jgi:hypothetical protein
MDIYLQYPWQIAAAALVPILVFAFLMYRREASLHPALRVGLAVLRAGVLMLMVLLLLQPTVRTRDETFVRGHLPVLVDVSDSMTIRDTRKRTADLVEAATVLGKMPWPAAASEGRDDREVYASYLSTKEQRDEVSMAPRNALLRGLFEHRAHDVFDRLSRRHDVRYFMFAGDLQAIGPGDRVAGVLSAGMPGSDSATRLGDAIDEVLDLYAGTPLSGIVLISDGASNAGTAPEDVARRMNKRGIPLYTVGVGLPHPSDVALRDLILKDVVFTRDLVSVKVRIASSGYEKRTVSLRAAVDDAVVAQKTVVLTGRPQFEHLSFQAKSAPGTAHLEVELSALPGEATIDNNKLGRTLRVMDDKIKVLYIEGSPRWEYRYLRAILKRDRRLDATFLMTEGDTALARASPDHIDSFPTEPALAFKYDVVILGDVEASSFEQQQLERMAELVSERGGSLMMIAGKHHAPAEYVDTPIAKLLPVRLEAGGRQDVSRHVHPVLTPAGKDSMVMVLESSDRRNEARWANVKPLGSQTEGFFRKPSHGRTLPA